MTTASDFEVMTVSDEADSAARVVDLPHGNTSRSARGAREPSVTRAPESAASHAGNAVTERDETPPVATVQERAQKAADDLAERVKGKFGSLAAGPSLLHAHPPTMAQHHQRAKECAAAHSTPVMMYACLAYRHLHWVLKFVLHAIEWCTDSFPKLLVTAAVVFIVIHWI